MKKWGIALSVLAVLCAAVLVLTMTGFWSPPWEAKAAPSAEATTAAAGPVTVKQGEDALYPSRDGSPEVAIPGTSLTGEGQLQVTPVRLSEGQHGWNIDLSGAQLTGKATITFKNAVVSGQPAPLVGFNENPGDPITYVRDARVSGSDLVVQTDHFSNWFTDNMGWLRGEMDRINAAWGNGEQPRCEGESQARADIQVQSDGGGAVQWCLGQTSNGLNVLKVNNSRGYAVSMERTPGLSVSSRSLASFGDMMPAMLAGVMTAPFGKGNSVDIVGPGETIEYRVPTNRTAKVRVDPSGPAYAATALWFAAQTTEMLYSRIYKDSVDIEAIGIAMDSADCVSGSQSVATADVTTTEQAGKYLNEALDFAMACSGRVLESIALKQGVEEIFLTNVASLLSWAWSGVRTAATGAGAVIDTFGNLDGYVIALTRGSPGATPTAEPLPVGTNSDLVGSWRGAVYGDQDGYDLVLQLQESGGTLSGVVDYPQLKCSGTWTELERTDEVIRFTELIDTDLDDRCVKELTSKLTRTEAGLHVYIKRFWVEIEADLVRQ